MNFLKINFWYYTIFMLLTLVVLNFISNVTQSSNADKLVKKAKTYATAVESSFNQNGLEILKTRKVINLHQLDSLPEYKDISSLNLQKLNRIQNTPQQAQPDSNINDSVSTDTQTSQISTPSANQ